MGATYRSEGNKFLIMYTSADVTGDTELREQAEEGTEEISRKWWSEERWKEWAAPFGGVCRFDEEAKDEIEEVWKQLEKEWKKNEISNNSIVSSGGLQNGPPAR